jgi:hypothetical protein
MRVCLSLCLQIIAPNTILEPGFNQQMLYYCVCVISFPIIVNGLIITSLTFTTSWEAVVMVLKVDVLIKRETMLQHVLTTDLLMHKTISNAPITFLYYRSSRFRMAGSGLGRSLSLHDVAELHNETDRSSSLLPPTTTASSSLLDVRERTRALRRFEVHTSTRLATPAQPQPLGVLV